MREYVTVRDVADLAGVSPGTVSRVLSARGEFTPRTRARVLDAVDALGYDRDRTRGGRPGSGSSTIELVVGRISSNWTNRVFAGVWSRAATLGLDVTVTQEQVGDEDDWPQRVTQRRSIGVILGPTTPTARQRAKLRGARLPLVLLSPLVEGPGGDPEVSTTDYRGGYSAGEHLVRRQVDEVIAVCGRPSYGFGRAREAGFRAAIAKWAPHLPMRAIRTGWDEGSAVPEVTDALRQARPGASIGIFACNDHLALRSYESAALAGLAVGRDVLVVGFDDDPGAASCDPSLTTIRQPIEAMGARAVDTLLAVAFEGASSDGAASTEMPTELVVRQSTGSASDDE